MIAKEHHHTWLMWNTTKNQMFNELILMHYFLFLSVVVDYTREKMIAQFSQQQRDSWILIIIRVGELKQSMKSWWKFEFSSMTEMREKKRSHDNRMSRFHSNQSLFDGLKRLNLLNLSNNKYFSFFLLTRRMSWKVS